MKGKYTVLGSYIRLNNVLRIINNPISIVQITVLVTNEVKNADKLDPFWCWAIPVLFPLLFVDIGEYSRKSGYQEKTKDGIDRHIYIYNNNIWWNPVKSRIGVLHAGRRSLVKSIQKEGLIRLFSWFWETMQNTQPLDRSGQKNYVTHSHWWKL